MPALSLLSPDFADKLRLNAAQTVSDLGRNHVSLALNSYTAGHTFHLVDSQLQLTRDSAIVLVDHAPTQNWGHPCTWRLHDAKTGELYAEHDALFPPNLAGDVPMDHFHAPLGFATPSLRPVIIKGAPLLNPAPAQVDEQRYAILFTSQISNRRHVEDLEFYWRLLVNRYGFTPSNVFVLCYNGALGATDVSGSFGNWAGDNTAYRMHIHASATTANLQAVFDTLKTRLRPKDQLFIHTNNHGSPSGLCVDSSSVITPSAFGTMLSGLPHLRSLVVTMEQCYSGAFQASVLGKSTATQTVFASAVPADKTSDGAAHFDPWAQMLARALSDRTEAGAALPTHPMTDLDGVVSIATACAWAKSNDHSPGDDPQYAESPAGAGHQISLALNPVRPSRAADLNGDGHAELLISSPWGIGVLETSGNTLAAPIMAANGTRLGDWLLNTGDNSFSGMGDFDGDGKAEILIASPWGIGILKRVGNALTPIMMAPNGTRFGGWLLNTADNTFGPIADFDGDGHAEVVVTSPWGIGLLKLSGMTMTAPMMQANGTRFGGWLIDTGINVFSHAADYDGDGRAELFVSSPWGIGLLKYGAGGFTVPMMQPNGTRFGGWLFASQDNWFGPAADYDGDGHAELLVQSAWGIGVLKWQGTTLTSTVMAANGTRFGGWLLNTGDNQFGPAAHFYGSGTSEVLVKSPWGIGLLRQSGSSFSPTMMAANGTRFGGWLLNTGDNTL